MPLLNLPKKQKEEQKPLTKAEEKALQYLPLEQILAANHDANLLLAMAEQEQREPEPALVRRDVLRAFNLTNIDPAKILKATAHLKASEKATVARSIALSFLSKSPKDLDFNDPITTLMLKLLNPEDAVSLDLFDFIIRYEELVKSKGKTF